MDDYCKTMPYDCKYYVMFYEDSDKGFFVHHLVGYDQMPNYNNILHNIEELVSDKDFGIGEKARSLSIKIIDKPFARQLQYEFQQRK